MDTLLITVYLRGVNSTMPVIYSILIIFGHILYIYHPMLPLEALKCCCFIILPLGAFSATVRLFITIHHPTARGAAAQARTRRAPLSLSSRHSTADRLLRDERGMLRKCFPLAQKTGYIKRQPTAECD